jgi:hypothetical protein
MLLRYRGEDPEEVAGLVEAAREAAGCGAVPGVTVDLDWPSYGTGRTRTAPWFLLAALALSQAGHRVLMHGSNEFSSGVPVPEALARLGLRPAEDRAGAAPLERPSGVSSASEESTAASASSRSETPGAGTKAAAWRLPRVMVPVLSSSSTSTSPAASTARPLVAMTLNRTSRSIPAMPMAESSPSMVVGIHSTA